MRNVILLKLYNFCEDFRLYAAFIILYFAEISGSYAAAMGVFAFGFLAQVAFEVPTGILSDRFLGRKKTLVLAATVDFCAVLCYACACNVFWLAAGELCEGLSRALTSGTDTAFLYETLKDEKKQADFDIIQGKTAAMFQLALFTGGVIGAATVVYSYRFVFALTLIPKAVQIALSFFFTEPSLSPKIRTAEGSLRQTAALFVKDRKLALFACADAVDFAFGEASYQFKSAFIRTLVPDWAVSLFYAATNLLSTAGFWFSGKVIRFLGLFNTFFGIRLVSLGATLVGLFLNNLASPFVFTATSLGYGPLNTASQTVYQRRFSDTERATCASFVSLAGSLLLCLTATGIGALADVTSPLTALIIAAVTPKLFSLPVYGILFKNNSSVEKYA